MGATRGARGDHNEIWARADFTPEEFRTDVPHSARIYDYWLGGTDNFEADRAAAEFTLRMMPQMLDYARDEPRPDADRGWAYGGLAPR
jgi:hypothetical protein